MYKNHVLTDSRCVQIGSRLAEDPTDEEREHFLHSIEGIYAQTDSAFQALAQITGYQNMSEILTIFAEKIVSNLMTSANASASPNSSTDRSEHMRIVD
jgi:hypothetical protein